MGNFLGSLWRFLWGSTPICNVANASDKKIFVKCQDKPKRNVNVKFQAKVPNIGGGEINIDPRPSSSTPERGWVAVGPGDHIAFPADRPYVSARSEKGTTIADNFHPGRNVGVIVKPEKTIIQAKDGSIWTARNRQKFHPNEDYN